MGLFTHRTPQQLTLESGEVALTPRRRPWSTWADAFGTLAMRLLQVMIVVAFAVLLILGIQQITVVTIPLVIALIVACAFWPVMKWLRRHGVPSLLGTLGLMLGTAAVLGGLGWLIVLAVESQWDDLYAQAQSGLDEFIAWAQQLPFFPSSDQLEEWKTAATDFLTSSQFGTGALASASAIANFLTGFVLFIVVLFFFLKDGPRLWEFVLRPFEGASNQRARRVGEKTVSVLGSYMRGTASVAAVDAVGILIGLLILQVPLALPLAVVVFVLAFIPIVGATAAGIIAALVALVANGWFTALLVVGVVILVNQLEGNLLQPVLMGRTMKLHSFTILIALTVGSVVGGVLGAVLAVPITASVWGAINVWDGKDTPARWARRKRAESP